MACSQVGTIKSVGIFLEDISLSLGTTSTDIGVSLGLFTAFSYFPAPLIVALYRVTSLRRVILILGACLISLGVTLTALATNNVLVAVYLSIAGIGNCMLAISSTLALDQLGSNQNFNLLYGVGMSGFGLGMVLLPILADVLGRAYGWRGGIFILGGLMANLVPCAMTIQVEPAFGQDLTTVHRANIDNFEESGRSEERFCNDRPTEEEETTLLCPERSPCTSSYQPEHQLLDDDTSMESTAVNKIQKEFQEQDQNSRQFLDRIRNSIRRSDFYRDPIFNVMFVSEFMFGMLYCGWHAFLVPHAIQRGYSIRATISMTLFASVGNFLGRLLAGALSDRLANPICLYLVAALLNASAILCDAFFHHYYVMLVTACISAMCIAGMAVMGPLAVRKRASPANFDVAYAVNELFFGSGTFFGGYLSGSCLPYRNLMGDTAAELANYITPHKPQLWIEPNL
ncbi:monocarboxylate transporter 12-like [Strongylocentrotus purpuratus]|uniref:Major facilitator superfamily (MFS) profile domain-containing protein n=1 Tax=Strongylocentrotus purpuratus TaxID=7668 RepID=A0A7M7PCA4_STRPU|nr:monocarboxylate transporter 12-like [Strongylocentrotus purpuratus]